MAATPPPPPDAQFETLAADEYLWRLRSYAEPEGEGQARQVDALPVEADLVILRRPIAGG